MAITDYATLKTRTRAEVDDLATGQAIMHETPQGTRDGINTVFQLQNRNLIAGSLFYTYGSGLSGIIHSSSGFSILDATAGYLQLAAAPDLNITFPFFFDYYFLWVVDADYQTWIDTATDEVGGVAGTATAEGLYPAIIAFVAAKFWARRSSDAARKAQASGGGAEENLNTVATNFRNLAKDAYQRGVTLRDDYYKRFGQRNAPSSWTITQGVTPYQGRR